MRLFEWGIATERGGQRRLSPVGVTDEEPRARARMLEALDAVPAGIPARGWVTVMRYVPGLNIYDRYHTPIRAERKPGGEVRWIIGGVDA
jgi:hypothetical protein